MELWRRYGETISANWHLGFTCFGGPAVQFLIFHRRFVEDLEWIDESMVLIRHVWYHFGVVNESIE